MLLFKLSKCADIIYCFVVVSVGLNVIQMIHVSFFLLKRQKMWGENEYLLFFGFLLMFYRNIKFIQCHFTFTAKDMFFHSVGFRFSKKQKFTYN